MSLPELEKFSQAKQPRKFTMIPDPSTDSLYLDSNVALEQRRQAKEEMGMKLPGSEDFAQSKQAQFTMIPDPSTDSLYLDSNVALEQRRQAKEEMGMKLPGSEDFAQSKQAQFTMIPNTSSDSLYLDCNVARGQRRQSEAEMKANDAAFQQAEGQEREGILAGMRHQLDTMVPGGSISEFGSSIGSAAQERIAAAKETIMESALPAAQGALRTIRGHIRSISGGSNEVEETVPDELSQEERECIDNLSNEQICDFLRERHMSNKHPLPAK
ncbi:hypothetical protein N7447_006549 [Penicillium robsamsonii]|uniref:uncharacterized protein n=1 Tax=Penicillium robsamsonii TaxID=1792511 RepID=UPI00254864F3|nr:uncharacterized protein N7447_006549 [Penicillium robsamsonii]KAJ5824209.1 hypothetical protein N7447_006549 [Penicillium robsamsonii]